MDRSTQKGQIVIELAISAALFVSLLMIGISLSNTMLDQQKNFRFQERRGLR